MKTNIRRSKQKRTVAIDEIDKAADELLLHCVREFHVESGSVFTANQQKPVLHLVKALGPRKNFHCGESTAIGEGIAGWVAMRKEPLHLTDDLAKARMVIRKGEARIKDFLSFPVMSGSNLLAVINLSGPRNGRKFGKRELTKCRVVAERCAGTLIPVVKRSAFVFPQRNLYKTAGGLRPPRRRLESEYRLLSLLPQCVLLFDPSLTMTYCNKPRELERLLGVDLLLKSRMSLLQLPLQIEEDVFAEKLKSLYKEDSAFQMKNIMVSGFPQRVINAFFCPVHGAGGGFRGGLALIEDATAHFEMQQRVMEVERLSLIGSLTSMITHEINNPLDGVTRLIRLSCANMKSGKPADEYLNEALKGLNRMGSLTKSLLGFSRINAEPAPLNTVIEDTLAICRHKKSGADISFHLDLAPENPVVNANDFHQLLANLVSNAIDAIVSDSGEITVTSKCQGSRLALTVADTGCGIPQTLRSRIFDAFWTTKGYGQGTGLGLAIVKKIVQRHGGSIHVESGENAGTTFHLTFPRDRLADL